MTNASYLKPATIALHAGHQPDAATGARAVPIYQTTSYLFDSVSTAASLYNVEQGGHIYSRVSNPTVSVLEQRLAALEGGTGAVCTASGMSAIFAAIVTLCSAGDHLVASAQIYGSTATLFHHTLPRLGIETDFIDINDTGALKAAIRPNTRLVFCESIANPGMQVANLPEISTVAHEAGVPVMVDATFATPALNRPFEHGANIVMHSVTKWIGGHGLAIGGVLIDGGNFDWGATGRHPQLTEPFGQLGGLRFWDEFGPTAFIMKVRAESMLEIGPAMSPHSAFLILQGLETLELRMQKHVANTVALRDWLVAREDVTWVSHPMMPDNPSKPWAEALFPKGAGASLCFGVEGGRAGGAAFIEATKIASHLANVGDSRTLVLHPGSTTHSFLSDEALRAAGISEDLIRVSVGLEDIEDLKADFKAGLKAAARAVASKAATELEG